MKNNIAIVGFGVAGQRFFAHLKNSNRVNISKIIVKKKRKIFFKGTDIGGTFTDIKNMNNLNAVIIATTSKASFKYAEFFLKKKIPILIEKPFCQTILQSKKLFSLSKKNKSLFLINYSDLYDPKYIKIINKGIKKIKKIKKIKANYGNNKTLYPVKKKYYPIQNWISHPVSMFLTICGDIKKFKIIDYKLQYKNGLIFEKVQIKLIKNNLDLIFNFSNFQDKKNRNIKIVGEKGFLKFNSYLENDNYIFYKKKEYIKSKTTSIENILNLFLNNIYKKNKVSNINIGIKEHYLSTAILKKISFIRMKKRIFNVLKQSKIV
jgi:predicted dehydrogenase